MTREIKERYLAQVDRALIRDLHLRERLMAEARKLVDVYAEENPDATYEDLLAAFGTPEEFAAEMLSTLPPEQVEGAKRKSEFRQKLFQTVVVVILLVTALFSFWNWQKLTQIVNGDFKVVVNPAEEITDEEMEESMRNTPLEAQSHLGG